MSNRSYAVAILSRHPEYVRALLASLQRTHKTLPDILVVCDRFKETIAGTIQLFTDDDFIYARNANRAFDFLENKDVILMNDDMECVEEDFLHKLVKNAYKYPQCGILSSLIDGGVGNTMQKWPEIIDWNDIQADTISIEGTRVDSIPVCFPCVLIKRDLIDHIGPLDENLTGYGFDDNDYCIRSRKAGYWTMIHRHLKIRHGCGGSKNEKGQNWSLSFSREPDKPSNREYFQKKYST